MSRLGLEALAKAHVEMDVGSASVAMTYAVMALAHAQLSDDEAKEVEELRTAYMQKRGIHIYPQPADGESCTSASAPSSSSSSCSSSSSSG